MKFISIIIVLFSLSFSSYGEIFPIPKIGVGEDFGELSSFLLSERNTWITGQIFHIDGGRSTLRIKA